MTSSLVGSEMCIRDSYKHVDIIKGDRVPLKSSLFTLDQIADMIQNAEAVSYTHLTLPTICSV
eukprot:9380156-Prorocentrum_lima.AAC.1